MNATEPTDVPEAALRIPEHRVSPHAIGYWRVLALITTAVVGLPVLIAAWVIPGLPGWVPFLAIAFVLALLVWSLVMPHVRFRIHRWEVTPTAIHTRTGWLGIDQRIAPLSRVQTVDSSQGALMRLFRISAITVTTASAAGPITIEGLDADVATRVVSELTEIVGRSEGDAT